MKRNYMSIIFIVFIIGLLSGILIKDYYKQEYLYINKDKLIKKEIKSTQKNIKVMSKEKKKMEKEIENLKSKNQDSKVANQINTLKEVLGYVDVKGSGHLRGFFQRASRRRADVHHDDTLVLLRHKPRLGGTHQVNQQYDGSRQ